MKNILVKNDKGTNISNNRKNKTYKKISINNANKNNPHKTFTEKKIFEKTLYNISVKNKSEINHFLNLDDENQYNLKLNTKFLSSIFKYNFGHSLEPPQLKNETVLNFQKFSNFSFYPTEIIRHDNIKKCEIFPPLFQYGAQYIINELHTSLYTNIKKIIKLQSHLRGYLFRKKIIINNLDKTYFEKKSIKAIIAIQKNVRGFLLRINIRKKIILKFINQKRKSAIDLIIRNMKRYLNILKIKKIIFIKYYLEQRKQKATYIQETFKNYKFYKSFKKLKKDIDKNYCLYYPYKAKKVEIIIYFDDENTKKKCTKYSFIYNKLLKCFILLINPSNFFSGKYKCQFVVDDIKICDERYPTIQHNNDFYNLIDLVPRNFKKIKIKAKKVKSSNTKINKLKLNSTKNKEFLNKKNLSNSSTMNIHHLKIALEDIMEEDDEGKSVTSKDYNNRYEKRAKLSDKNIKIFKSEEIEKEKEKELKLEENKNFEDDDDSFDFTEEEYLKIKKIKNKNIDKTNFTHLKNELNENITNNKNL